MYVFAMMGLGYIGIVVRLHHSLACMHACMYVCMYACDNMYTVLDVSNYGLRLLSSTSLHLLYCFNLHQ
jgi:hypothetical protein